jgi:putative transposase
LNAHWFESLEDAITVVEAWRVEYNESRPHRALGEVPPAEYARRFKAHVASTDCSIAEGLT